MVSRFLDTVGGGGEDPRRQKAERGGSTGGDGQVGRGNHVAAPVEREMAWVERGGEAWQELVSFMVALVVSGARQPNLCFGAEIE